MSQSSEINKTLSEAAPSESIVPKKIDRHRWSRANTRVATANLPNDVYEAFKAKALEQGKSVNGLLVELVTEYVQK